MPLQGILFDLDGVLCSTDEYHYRAWKELADSISVPFDRTVNERLRGISRMDSLEIILEKSAKTYTPEEKRALADRKNARYRELLQNLSPKDADPDVVSTLMALRKRDLHLCVASSSKNARFILDRLALTSYFDRRRMRAAFSRPASGTPPKSARAITISPVFPTFFPSAIGFKKEEPHEIRPGTV